MKNNTKYEKQYQKILFFCKKKKKMFTFELNEYTIKSNKNSNYLIYFYS